MKRIVFSVVLLAAVVATGQEWEGDLLGAEGDLHGMLGVTWDSKYIWRGFDIFDNVSATHFLTDLNLFDSGFGVSAVGHRPNSSGSEDLERWDYTAYYQNGVFAGEPLATNFRVGWVYYSYPELNEGESIDLQEGHVILSWPNLVPIKGFQPSCVVVKAWPSDSGSRLPDAASGWLYILMLDYAFSIPGIVPDIPEHVVKLHSELVYNDGFTPTPARRYSDWSVVYPNPDHGFSNAVFGVSTDLAFGDVTKVIFTPAVYYQITMDNSINRDDDELWASFALKYTF